MSVPVHRHPISGMSLGGKDLGGRGPCGLPGVPVGSRHVLGSCHRAGADTPRSRVAGGVLDQHLDRLLLGERDHIHQFGEGAPAADSRSGGRAPWPPEQLSAASGPRRPCQGSLMRAIASSPRRAEPRRRPSAWRSPACRRRCPRRRRWSPRRARAGPAGPRRHSALSRCPCLRRTAAPVRAHLRPVGPPALLPHRSRRLRDRVRSGRCRRQRTDALRRPCPARRLRRPPCPVGHVPAHGAVHRGQGTRQGVRYLRRHRRRGRRRRPGSAAPRFRWWGERGRVGTRAAPGPAGSGAGGGDGDGRTSPTGGQAADRTERDRSDQDSGDQGLR
ncbi:hypothetical protein SCANM63S_09498 [Streptomyces canarius]